MIKEIRYRGVLIPESRLPGQGKRDGLTPNYAQGIRLSPNRWLILYDTVDVRGFDIWHGVYYQVRADAPDGPVLREVLLTPPQPAASLPNGDRLWRQCGQPAVFGVPKGSGERHENIFILTWMNVLVHEAGGALKRAAPELQRTPVWPKDLELDDAGYREVLQVRLNGAGDDLEILSPRQRLRQVGNPDLSYFGWTQPVPDNPDRTTWLEAVCLLSRIGVIRYDFNPAKRLYEWTRSGPLLPVGDGCEVGEPSLVKLGEHDYVIAVRGFNQAGQTYWYRTPDPLAGIGKPTGAPDTYGQRYAFRCADGRLRVFLNNRRLSPYGDRRNPLYLFDVDPDTFAYGRPQVLADTRELGLRLTTPFVDHVHLFEPQDDRQLISHRTITARQVANSPDFPDVTPDEWRDGGIHYSEIVYAPPR